MSVGAGDEEHRTGRDRLDVREGVEVHELGVAAERRMRRRVRAVTPSRAVEVVEFAINRTRLVIEFFGGSAGELRRAAYELDVALLRRQLDERLSLLNGHGMPKPVAAGGAHVVHADRRNRFDARVDLGGADDEASAAANSDRTDLLPIDTGLGA